MELGGTWLEVKVKEETWIDLQRKYQYLSKGQDIKCLLSEALAKLVWVVDAWILSYF